MGRIGNSGLAALTLSTAFAACNVLDFGARGDGITIDTLPIRAAVSACAGSALIFPAPHVFLTGPQNLSSDSSYIIEDGAMIKAIPGPADWPIAAGLPSYAPDYWRYQPFLWAYDQRNVSVSGGGAIDGSGATYWCAGDVAEGEEKKGNLPHVTTAEGGQRGSTARLLTLSLCTGRTSWRLITARMCRSSGSP